MHSVISIMFLVSTTTVELNIGEGMGLTFPRKPTKSHTNLFEGLVAVDCYGLRNELERGPFDYRLNGFKSGSKFVRFIKNQLATGYPDIERFYVPDCTTFNALMWDEALYESQPWMRGYTQESMLGWRQEIWGGKQVAGVLARQGSAVWLSLGDCPAIVLAHVEGVRVESIAVMHGGGKELYCIYPKGDKRRARKHDSVVPVGLRAVTGGNMDLVPQVHAGIFCSISGKHFGHAVDDPKYPTNKRLIDEIMARYYPLEPEVLSGEDPRKGLISLPHVIMAQLQGHGVRKENIYWDGVDTFSDKDVSGNYLWPSNKRGDKARLGVMAYINS